MTVMPPASIVLTPAGTAISFALPTRVIRSPSIRTTPSAIGDAALADVIPVQGAPFAPHLDCCGEVRAQTRVPAFHAALIAGERQSVSSNAQGAFQLFRIYDAVS